MEPVTGTYYEALTRLLLTGGFSRGREDAAPTPTAPAETVVEAVRPSPRVNSAPIGPRNVAAARMPPRRATRQRKFRFEPEDREGRTHPGRILADRLFDLGVTASDLARDIGVPVNRVTAILNGQRGVTADTALRLAHWFGAEPEEWLQLQLQYELALAREENGLQINGLPKLADRVP
ncbi:MAG TPA: HigA family addiction module antitoxin [Methylocystis sp.]